jgi:hypothetical protein
MVRILRSLALMSGFFTFVVVVGAASAQSAQHATQPGQSKAPSTSAVCGGIDCSRTGIYRGQVVLPPASLALCDNPLDCAVSGISHLISTLRQSGSRPA